MVDAVITLKNKIAPQTGSGEGTVYDNATNLLSDINGTVGVAANWAQLFQLVTQPHTAVISVCVCGVVAQNEFQKSVFHKTKGGGGGGAVEVRQQTGQDLQLQK